MIVRMTMTISPIIKKPLRMRKGLSRIHERVGWTSSLSLLGLPRLRHGFVRYYQTALRAPDLRQSGNPSPRWMSYAAKILFHFVSTLIPLLSPHFSWALWDTSYTRLLRFVFPDLLLFISSAVRSRRHSYVYLLSNLPPSPPTTAFTVGS